MIFHITQMLKEPERDGYEPKMNQQSDLIMAGILQSHLCKCLSDQCMCLDIVEDFEERDLRCVMSSWHPDEDFIKRKQFLKKIQLFSKSKKDKNIGGGSSEIHMSNPLMLTEEGGEGGGL